MAAQLKKVVFEPDLLRPEYIGPDRRDLLLSFADRSHVAFLQQARIGFGQGLAVQLAIGSQRHALEEDQVGRYHVVRQGLTHGRLELFAQCRLVGFGGDRVSHQVGNQPFIVSQHCGFAHSGLVTQARLDLAQFDTETAYLDLVVDPADVLHDPLGAITRQVASAIDALAAGGKRMGNEALGGHRWPLVVAPGQADATDQQLASRALRARSQSTVEDEQRGVGDRTANEGLRLDQPVGRRPDSGLGRPIQVPDRALQFEHALGQVGRQRLTATQALDAPQHCAGTRTVQQHAPGRWSRLQDAGAAGLQ